MTPAEIITSSKNFGLHQKLQFFYVAVANIINSIHMVASVFIAANIEFRCVIPTNDTEFSLSNDTLDAYFRFDEEAKEYDFCQVVNQTTSELQKCTTFVYDRSQFTETIISQFDLVCDRTRYSTEAGVVYMGGLLVGSLVSGYVSDFLGRKVTVMILIWLQGILALSVAFSPSIEVFMVLRFFLGAVSIGAICTAFILMIEISPQDWRPVSAIVQTLGWCVGVMLLSLLSYFIRDWHYLQISFACFSVPLMLAYWWLLYESPSWLISKGRHEKALEILQIMKKRNKLDNLDLSTIDFDKQEDLNKENMPEQKEKWIMVLKSPTLLLNIIINSFQWFTVSMGYYGLALNVGNLVGDLYINNFIGGLVEVPAYLLLFVTVKLGRKWPYVSMMVIGGAALIASAFLIVYTNDPTYNVIIITVSMIGKFMVSSGFELIYFWCTEMYPTQKRNFLMGINSMSARVGGMLSPVIADIPKYSKGLAFRYGIAPMVFGAFMMAGGLLAVLIPETNKCPLPETIAEANTMKWNWNRRKVTKQKRTGQDGEVELTSYESEAMKT